MGLFDKKMEPVFLKDSSEAKEHLIELERLLGKATAQVKLNIEKDIKLLSYGIAGEENIAFELKNSHIPMYVLHDVYIEDEDLSAQIDYLVITQKRIFVIECKNLYGDIEVNSSGDFVRTLSFNGKKFREGIYSPITQNQRHLNLLKKIRSKRNNNLLTKALFEKIFDDYYKSIVVLANPKTVLNMKYATKETKSKVIRADQLIEYIKRVNMEPGVENSSLKSMEELAKSFLDICVANKMDYTKKYSDILEVEDAGPSIDEDIVGKKGKVTQQNVELAKQLKVYRLNKSREENVKPYFLFNDRQLDDLLCKMPKSKDELKGISGFGDIKCEKYGDEIVSIINKVVYGNFKY